MKQFLLVCCATAFSFSLAQAGSESYSKENKTVAPPPCSGWYADSESNVGISAAYAFTDNDYPTPANTIFQGGRPIPINGGSPGPLHDAYLEADHAWGGGIDVKYFFKRYFGIGIEGFGLNARRSFGTVTVLPPVLGFVGTRLEIGTGHDERLIGGVLTTFTFRYPIGCSRFAPYVWLGGGTIFGGGELDEIIINDSPSGAIIERFHRGNETKAIGQFGGGFEVRLTPHLGWTNDFSWNVINGRNNNFGMARTGINFGF
jgi:hypothetical protein